MKAIRDIVKIKNNSIVYKLPKDFGADSAEVIIFPVQAKKTGSKSTDIHELRERWKSFCETLPEKEPEVSEDEIVSLVKEARAERYGKRKK